MLRATFALQVSLCSLPLGGVPAREHNPLFLWCAQPHPTLLQFLSTSGTIIQNLKCVRKRKQNIFSLFSSSVSSTKSTGWCLNSSQLKVIYKSDLPIICFVINITQLFLQLMGVLPILPLLFPVMWVLLNAFGEARVLAEFSRASPAGLVRDGHTYTHTHINTYA